jgi:hypothetical protein
MLVGGAVHSKNKRTNTIGLISFNYYTIIYHADVYIKFVNSDYQINVNSLYILLKHLIDL